jgi:hypothetical protein
LWFEGSLGKQFARPNLKKKKKSQKRGGGVAQGVGPEFKAYTFCCCYHNNKNP